MTPPRRNPCRSVRRYRENRRERFLTPGEYRRLGGVLDEAEADSSVFPSAVPAILLLLLTGCRRNEIVTLRRDDVDRTAGELHIRDGKTGHRRVPLTPAVEAVLERIPRIEGNPWVITGQKGWGPSQEPDVVWLRLRERAGLEGVRIHDCRRSYASRALALGEGRRAPDRTHRPGHRRGVPGGSEGRGSPVAAAHGWSQARRRRGLPRRGHRTPRRRPHPLDPNDNALGLLNSGVAEVASVRGSRVSIRLEDGRMLEIGKHDPRLRHLDHAWAATVHGFQGRTVDNVIAVMEAAHPHLTTRKTFYVEISRARHGAELVTDDARALREQLEAVTGERIAALEAVEPAMDKPAAKESA